MVTNNTATIIPQQYNYKERVNCLCLISNTVSHIVSMVPLLHSNTKPTLLNANAIGYIAGY